MTRAEFVAIAVRVLGLEVEDGEDEYTDISGSWARSEINAASAAGVIGGYPDGSFRPDAAITRAEAVRIMNALLGRDSLAVESENPWSDVDESDWYYMDVLMATVG